MPLRLYFSLHTPEAFTQEFDRLFSQAQIFVLEHASGSDVDLDEYLYSLLSTGKTTPSHMMSYISDPLTDPAFYQKLCEMIDRSNKTILLERSPLSADEIKSMLSVDFKEATFDQNLDIYKRKLAERANCHRKRDESFARQLKDYCQKYRDKEILVMRGAAHQCALESYLKSNAIQFDSYLSHNPMPGDTQTEIISKMECGGNTNRKELLTALAELMAFKRAGYDPKKHTIAQLKELQRPLATLSEEQLERYLNESSQNSPNITS